MQHRNDRFGGPPFGPRRPFRPGFGPDRPAPRFRPPGPRPAPDRPPGRSDEGAPLPILFRERDFLAVDKPAGMWPDARPGGAARRVAMMLRARGRLDAISALDRDASGVLVVGPVTPRIDAVRHDTQAKGSERRFLALVVGTPPDQTGSVQSHLRVSRRGLMEPVAPGESTDDAALAVSLYRVLASGNGLSLVELRDRTAVPGQARAHLAQLGCPIVGDKSFSASRDDLARLALHLADLSFVGPGGQRVRIQAPPPPLFRAALTEGFRPIEPDVARPATATAAPPARTDDAGWEHVAGWYDDLIEDRRSDHHDEVLYPGVLRLLDLQPGEALLDIACGQGALCRLIAAQTPASRIVGVDAAPSLIAAAAERSPSGLDFHVADARSLDPDALGGPFDAVACVTALMNIDEVDAALRSAAACLRPGGRFVAAILHPAFRIPGATAWQWGTDADGQPRQSRAVDAYLRPRTGQIVMNPGAVASGAPPVHTQTFHRPISAYVAACRAADLVVDALEEWPSHRVSEPGPRAAEENRARAEIPMFLAFRALRPA